ncbi:MAG: hypothetical protein HY434_02400 [Candidatus Liptonbacteria bacterium]|nr:hypothetical protein [Candidatus Liptonbacteria bacterium]
MKHRKKVILTTLTVTAALFIFLAPARAQQSGLVLSRVEGPRLMITWKTNTYVPSWFTGKALPTANSPITASVELIDNGTRVDLSGQQVYWYVNSEFTAGGVGLRKISFNAPSVAQNTIDLRVELPSYGSDQANPVLKTIEIPVVVPEAVIESPFPRGRFSSTSIGFKGWPFFFNVGKSSQLNFSWSVNGQSSQNLESPESLTVTLNSDAPSGSPVNVNFTAGIPGSITEVANAGVNLIFVK